MSPIARSAAVAAAVTVLALTGASSAGAHIQVTPATVAPNDPVEFTVLVPGERDARTTKVDLKLPAGLIPFSYQDVPGWKRRLIKAANGSTERVVWTGRLAPDGFAAFRFLAGTPEKATTLTFKALQTYDDGFISRWIGSPDAESPAPVVRVVAGTPKQNAGGEGESEPIAAATTGAAASSASDAGSQDDWVARGLGIAALVVALAGLVLVLRRRPSA